MANLIWNVANLTMNAQRNYPLADTASCVDETGNFRIPTDFLVALDLPVRAGGDTTPDGFFLRQIRAYSGGYYLIFAVVTPSSSIVDVAASVISRSEHTLNQVYLLNGIPPFDDTLGKICIGSLETINEQPLGIWSFTPESGKLDPSVVRPQIRHVSGIVVANGSQRSAPLRGVIELVAGANTRLTPVVTETGGKIRIDFIRGEGTSEECVCDEGEEISPPIRRIQGIAPTESGDFIIEGSNCIRFEEIPNGIRVIDTCSQACCSCPELEAITKDLERLNSEVLAIEDFMERLRNSVEMTNLVILSSRLGDRPCVQ